MHNFGLVIKKYIRQTYMEGYSTNHLTNSVQNDKFIKDKRKKNGSGNSKNWSCLRKPMAKCNVVSYIGSWNKGH